jgi:hypothetical protein
VQQRCALDSSKRDRVRADIQRTLLDLAARNAAIHQMRMRADEAYRRRYGRFLRGEIEMRDVDQGETLEAWYARQTQED